MLPSKRGNRRLPAESLYSGTYCPTRNVCVCYKEPIQLLHMNIWNLILSLDIHVIKKSIIKHQQLEWLRLSGKFSNAEVFVVSWHTWTTLKRPLWRHRWMETLQWNRKLDESISRHTGKSYTIWQKGKLSRHDKKGIEKISRNQTSSVINFIQPLSNKARVFLWKFRM